MLREELIGQIRESMNSVFEDLVLNNIRNPLATEGNYGSFSFQKGSSKSYHYKNLLAERRLPLTYFLISLSKGLIY